MNSRSEMSASSDSDEPLLSSKQVAAKQNVSSRTILNWYYNDIIPAEFRVGKVIRFRLEDVREALKKTRRPPRPSGDPEDVIRLALWHAAPDVAEEPKWIMQRDPTEEEARLAAQLSAIFFQKMSKLESRKERRHFCSGAVDAALFDKGFFE